MRRTLTVIFTDIVASTEVLGGLRQRSARRLLAEHLDLMAREADRRRGHVIKGVGDGVMASFTAAHDALEAAVAMQRATTAGPLRIRVGISSGDVESRGGDLYGTAVIEASRLCAHAAGGQVLATEGVRLLARGYEPLRHLGELSLKGLPEPTPVWEAVWSPGEAAPLRVVLADDAVLVREGIARLLEDSGIEVLAQTGDPESLIRAVDELRPDLAIVDVRMPPTHTLEGLEAAEQILVRHPATAVLLLSQDVQPIHAERLRTIRPTGVGYLLKERVTDVRDFAATARRLVSGDIAFDA